MTARETTHACPPEGSGLTPCCERTPFELPGTDRMTLDESMVTCGRPRTRETTLGALTAADLGKRVVMDGVDGPLGAVLHERLREGDVWVGVETLDGIVRRWCGSHPPTTPVIVHDEEDA